MQTRGLVESFIDSYGLPPVAHETSKYSSSSERRSWGQRVGEMLSSSLTSFIVTPSAAQISLAMRIFLDDDSLDEDMNEYLITSHPTRPFVDFEGKWLLGEARVDGGSTQLDLSPLYYRQVRVPMLRCDVINMTRNVHHHYDYIKDGHTRTYTMMIQTMNLTDHSVELPLGSHPNHNSIVSVGIVRDKDGFFIPYTSIYGVTLISMLRIGLIPEQRDDFYKKFLRLPLYEDMAPWNIVFMGSDVEYIDYDTRDVNYNLDIPKAYQVMSVLMNYKRTVEDFKKCGSKASTVYGLPYVSDCVGKASGSLSCPGLKKPVPCGDGVCHSDYISCLKSLAENATKLAQEAFGPSLSSNMWTIDHKT